MANSQTGNLDLGGGGVDCAGGQTVNCLNASAGNAFGSTPLPLITIIGNVIGVVLGLMGILFVCLTIYGGFVWMVARGNDKEVQRGRDMIVQSTIGLGIVLSAYALTYFIVGALESAVGIR